MWEVEIENYIAINDQLKGLHHHTWQNDMAYNRKRLKIDSVLQSAAFKMSLVVIPANAPAQDEAQ